MKIRNGYVSNSSSSSFVVIFPKEPKSVEDVQKILFGKKKFYGSPWGDDKYPVEQVAKTVWDDICSQKKNNTEKALDILANSHGGDAPDYHDYDHITDRTKMWAELQKAQKQYAKKIFNEFFNTRKNKLKKLNNEPTDEVFYCFSYADDDGSYFSALEHGDLFENVKSISISNH